MAKDEKKEASGVDEQRARLGRGEQLQQGWCFDGDRDPDIFRCSEDEQAVASGEYSQSWDGTKLMNVRTGEMTDGERIDRSRPVTLMEMNAASGGKVASAGGDTVTTGNPPPGTAAARG